MRKVSVTIPNGELRAMVKRFRLAKGMNIESSTSFSLFIYVHRNTTWMGFKVFKTEAEAIEYVKKNCQTVHWRIVEERSTRHILNVMEKLA